MRITAGRRKTIDELAGLLASIAPATSRGKGFCVRKVAEERGLKQYWREAPNKRKMIAGFLEQVFRHYPRRPKQVVLTVIEGGIRWSANRGRAVTRDELGEIAAKMAELGFSMAKELDRIALPDPSRVAPPSLDLASIADRLELHEALKDDCVEMFRNGHLNEAVRKALERFEVKIQATLGDHVSIGKALMAKAFKKDSPAIPINDLRTGTDESEQEGFMLLTMGAMAGLRNLYSHGDLDTMPAMDALERLAFVSMLFKRVDAALSKRKP
jgi:uncharacterized protein (TIGR02391 family)